MRASGRSNIRGLAAPHEGIDGMSARKSPKTRWGAGNYKRRRKKPLPGRPETLEEYLKRGGEITYCKPCKGWSEVADDWMEFSS